MVHASFMQCITYVRTFSLKISLIFLILTVLITGTFKIPRANPNLCGDERNMGRKELGCCVGMSQWGGIVCMGMEGLEKR